MKTFKSIEKLLNGYGYVLSEKTLSSSFCAKTYKYVIYQEKGFRGGINEANNNKV